MNANRRRLVFDKPRWRLCASRSSFLHRLDALCSAIAARFGFMVALVAKMLLSPIRLSATSRSLHKKDLRHIIWKYGRIFVALTLFLERVMVAKHIWIMGLMLVMVGAVGCDLNREARLVRAENAALRAEIALLRSEVDGLKAAVAVKDGLAVSDAGTNYLTLDFF